MNLNLKNLIAVVLSVVLFSMAIVLLPSNPALAATVDSNSSDTLQQAAQEVVKDTGVKEQFGKSANGDGLLDQAQEKASQKLENLAQKADSETKLPESKQLFLNNLSGKS